MIHEIGKGTGIFCSEGAGSRVYYIARPEPMLVDSGAPGRGEAILRDLASIGVQPINIRKIVLTHHHLGHTGGVWELKRRSGAFVLAHQADVPYITGQRPRRSSRRPKDQAFYSSIARVGDGDAMVVSVEMGLLDGDMVNDWRVIHTPGQTPGHICLYRGDILISGDLIAASPGGFREAPSRTITDPTSYRASLSRIAALDFDTILPAHDPPYVVEASTRFRELLKRKDHWFLGKRPKTAE